MRGGHSYVMTPYCNRYRVTARSSNTPDSKGSLVPGEMRPVPTMLLARHL